MQQAEAPTKQPPTIFQPMGDKKKLLQQDMRILKILQFIGVHNSDKQASHTFAERGQPKKPLNKDIYAPHILVTWKLVSNSKQR